jgi:hypothetical protein
MTDNPPGYSMAARVPAFHPTDRYQVCRLSDNVPVEGHYTLQRATDAARAMDEHNERTGNAERYIVHAAPAMKDNTP